MGASGYDGRAGVGRSIRHEHTHSNTAGYVVGYGLRLSQLARAVREKVVVLGATLRDRGVGRVEVCGAVTHAARTYAVALAGQGRVLEEGGRVGRVREAEELERRHLRLVLLVLEGTVERQGIVRSRRRSSKLLVVVGMRGHRRRRRARQQEAQR